MRPITSLILVSALFGFGIARGQVTNPPATEFEIFQQQTNTLIVRGFSEIGSVALGNATLAIHALEGNDVTHGQKIYGVAVKFSEAFPDGRRENLSLMADFDELDSLAGGIEYLSRLTGGVTSLNGFEATYATKSGLRIIAHSDRRQGSINTFIQFNDRPRIAANSDQLNQLRSLIVQARTTLAGIK